LDYKRKLRQSIFSKYVFISVGVYVIWVAFWMINADIWLTDILLFDAHLPNRANPSSFSISYAASAFDSLVFFICVGLILSFLSMRSPEDENLAKKVEYIFPGTEADDNLSKYLQKSISSLACISPETKRTVTFQDIKRFDDKGFFAIKIYTKTNALIKNIHNNHEYVLDDAIFKVNADLIEDIEVLGEIHDLAIMQRLNNNELIDKTHILNGACTLTNENNAFTKQYSMQLRPDETIQFMTSGWMWQSSEDVMTYTAARYTTKQQIELCNELDFELKIRLTSPTKGVVHISIPPNDRVIEIFDTLIPGQHIEMKIESDMLTSTN
jgi:hypothetical protein